AVELAGEGKRYWDIIRWGIADSVLNKGYYSMHISMFNPDGSLAGYEPSIWVRTSLTDSTQESLFPIPNGVNGGNFIIQYSFQSPRNYIWPIPQFAIDASKGVLKQNPLWQ
ncbi:MAG: RagB/SusD family nutrient uptake outer membrane protein, partial [Chitinophagaceae bacterium]